MNLKNQSLLIKVCVIFFVILMFCLIFFKISTETNSENVTEEQKNSLFSKVDKNSTVNVSKYIVYGTHFNIEGTLDIIKLSGINVSYVDLALRNLNGNELELKVTYNYSDGTIAFSTSDEINSGLDLESLSVDDYYVFLKVAYSNSDIKYYSLQNSTKYNNITYYTITKNSHNNKIYISFDKHNETDYMKIGVESVSNLPEDVYDIAIDPSHGGTDKGATVKGYNESEIVLDMALLLKSKLEENGFKVFISRDGTEDPKENTEKTVYDNNGRINLLNESHAKLLISLNLNDNNYSSKNGGVEVYAPNNCNLNFASTLAKNIVDYSDSYYSELNSFRKSDGVYVRNFTNSDILAYKTKATKSGYEPYNITSSTPYLYIIREVGGICTNAFIDGRNTSYGKNKFVDSNIGIEAYSIELGYIRISQDLENIINYKDSYIDAMCKSIISYYDI